MPQHHELVIRLDKHLSGQVDRGLHALERLADALAVDTSKLDEALGRNKSATDRLQRSIDQNAPKS